MYVLRPLFRIKEIPILQGFFRSLSISGFFHIMFSADLLGWERLVDSISVLPRNNQGGFKEGKWFH